jgi:hypothetical protein
MIPKLRQTGARNNCSQRDAMAETDDPTQPRGRQQANRSGGKPSAQRQGNGARAVGTKRRRGPPLQIDAAANRITATFPLLAGRTRTAQKNESGIPAITELDPDDEIEPLSTETIEPFVVDPAEPAMDLDANVYIAAEHGEQRRSGARKQQRQRRTVTNPFGRIETVSGPRPRFGIPNWQKYLMGICAVAVLCIAYVVFGTGSTKLPGWDQGVLVRTQIEFLEQQIHLPYMPQSVTWQVLTQEEQERYGATKLRLIAVMKFTPEQAAELVARSTAMPQLDGAEAIESHRWFPDEARELMSDLDIDSDSSVYSADVFFDGVFQRGTMVRLGDSGYIVAKLFDY